MPTHILPSGLMASWFAFSKMCLVFVVSHLMINRLLTVTDVEIVGGVCFADAAVDSHVHVYG
jgi:hypothetical protein